MERCIKCIMPYNYPGIEIDNEGVCNFCRNYIDIDYKGPEALKSDILSYKRSNENTKYDCAVGFSGGRDSSYLLYFLSKVLKLKVIAFFIDNGLIPSETHENVKNITKILNVDLVTKKYNYLERCVNHHIKAWLHKPSAAMVSALCVGCRLGLAKGTYELTKKYNVPVYMNGSTPFEGNLYKSKLLRINPKSRIKTSLVAGYILQISKNMKWL